MRGGMRHIEDYSYSKVLTTYILLLSKYIKNKFISILLFGVIVLSMTYILHFYTQSNSISPIMKQFNNDYRYIVSAPNDGQPSEGVETVPLVEVDVSQYKDTNADTVGYLTIPFIDLGLPIVQADTNEEYLHKDFNGKKNEIGWVFLDSRSRNLPSEENKVIYGHNVITNNMFGNLKNLTNYKGVEPQYIHYNTEQYAITYEIVSVYVTHNEDWSYIQRDFTADEKVEFIKTIQNKNIVPSFSDKPIHFNDSFITLSTCYGIIGTTKRLAIHAKKVKEVYHGDM